jgi:hypothetical protein
MRRKVNALLAGLVAVVVVVVVLAFVIIPGGAEGIKSHEAAQVVAAAPDGPAEGIVVHGHWTLEVRNPDGSLTEQREFDNDLMTDGSVTLAQVLARQKTITGWDIGLMGTISPFLNDSGGQAQGMIVDSTFPGTGRQYFKNLTIEVPTSGENLRKLVLSGTATAHQDGGIMEVRTHLWVQPATATSTGSYLGVENVFTYFRLPTIVNLTASQTVTATVVISFS